MRGAFIVIDPAGKLYGLMRLNSVIEEITMTKRRKIWASRFPATAAIGLSALAMGLVYPVIFEAFSLRSSGSSRPAIMASLGAQGRNATVTRQIPVPRPPMGWNSWNSFSNTVDSDIVIEQAKALLASGMEKAGYRYVNIDEGWWLGKRDRDGNIVVDPKQWPALAPGERAGDMANIARYIHSLGLKAGIYTDAGPFGCGYVGPDLGPPEPNTGSLGHYDQDFLQFAKWGFDYVKVDWCGGDHENLDPAVQYAEIARAIAKTEAETGHHLFFSICNWGRQSPWTWAPGIGGVAADIWRTSGDITAPIVAGSIHANRSAGLKNVLANFDRGMHPEAQHTGYYNDLDMMVLGMRGMSEASDQVHMSLWAIAGAPLIVGADVTKLSKRDLAILTNPEVIAVDQDILGLQCVKVAEPSAGLQVWAKPLAGTGRRAVVFLNRTSHSAPISVHWSELGLRPSTRASVRDLWAHRNLGSYTNSYTVSVPANDVAMLTIGGIAAKAIRYEAASAANGFTGGAAPAPCKNCFGGESVMIGGKRSLTFDNVTSTVKFTFLHVAYVNSGTTPIVGVLQVNGESPTKVVFPPTGSENTIGTIAIEAKLKRPGENNALTFSSPCNAGIALVSISVSSW